MSFCALCLTGRKAGRVGCRLLCHAVQTFRPSADGARSKQLQKVCSPQPVCHPQEPVHQRHAGKEQLKHGAVRFVFVSHVEILSLNYRCFYIYNRIILASKLYTPCNMKLSVSVRSFPQDYKKKMFRHRKTFENFSFIN